jgi:hypothetical protein
MVRPLLKLAYTVTTSGHRRIVTGCELRTDPFRVARADIILAEQWAATCTVQTPFGWLSLRSGLTTSRPDICLQRATARARSALPPSDNDVELSQAEDEAARIQRTTWKQTK